jgi:3-methylcrotonyl-CoA carboxylase alpha subunit
MPDSGKLIHVRLPPQSTDVRVDAGFVQGDEISSFYDPMISKLIVRAPTRQLALQKLRAALESYEIAGPVTNIEFIKKLCVSPGFVTADELETGYINLHKDELFQILEVPSDAYVQAAVGLLLAEREKMTRYLPEGRNVSLPLLGGNGFQSRTWTLAELPADGKSVVDPVPVTISERSPTKYVVTVRGETYPITISPSSSDATSTTFTTYFPHSLHTTTLVRDTESSPSTVLTLWHLGKQHRFTIPPPKWLDKALGSAGASPTNSVVAPMPCKVLRVDVKAGDRVTKDQVLAVVESMKMETVIRSPVEGIVKRVVHGAGDMCKAGTALVEFEEEAA